MALKKAAKHAAKKTTPKKAAKKVAPKKAAKKAAGRNEEMRRCYEHFGRVSALLSILSDEHRELVVRLGSLAQQLLRQSEPKQAADALRAAEHLAFGRTAAQSPVDAALTDALRATLGETIATLIDRAEVRIRTGVFAPPVEKVYRTLRGESANAQDAGHLYAAVELARAAEALSHVDVALTGRLRAGQNTDWKSLEQPRA